MILGELGAVVMWALLDVNVADTLSPSSLAAFVIATYGALAVIFAGQVPPCGDERRMSERAAFGSEWWVSPPRTSPCPRACRHVLPSRIIT